MSTPLPPLPPPLPPSSLLKSEHVDTQEDVGFQFYEQEVQSEEEMLQEMRELIRRRSQAEAEESKVALLFVSFLQPILQRGPVCGLVALGMAAERYAPTISLDAILDAAKFQKMTKSGEMFSAQNMHDLAKEILGCEAELLNTETSGALERLLSTLLNGDLILLPYDADHNHSPTQRQGHSAHWALLVGFVVLASQEEMGGVFEKGFLRTIHKGILHKDPCTMDVREKGTFLTLALSLPSSGLIFCGRHGKSKHVGVWDYHDLIRSNQNLKEVGKKITEKSEDFVLYPIEHTLCSQVILIRKKTPT